MKPVASGNLYSIYVAFLLRATLKPRLVMSCILILTYAAFVLRGAFVARLSKSVTLF